VNLRSTVVGAMPRPPLRPVRAEGDARDGARPVYFDGWQDTPVYRRDGLSGEIAGPAIVQEFGSTLPLHPGFTARVDDLGNLVVSREA
jgi:N-methylhydantoinase A